MPRKKFSCQFIDGIKFDMLHFLTLKNPLQKFEQRKLLNEFFMVSHTNLDVKLDRKDAIELLFTTVISSNEK